MKVDSKAGHDCVAWSYANGSSTTCLHDSRPYGARLVAQARSGGAQGSGPMASGRMVHGACGSRFINARALARGPVLLKTHGHLLEVGLEAQVVLRAQGQLLKVQ